MLSRSRLPVVLTTLAMAAVAGCAFAGTATARSLAADVPDYTGTIPAGTELSGVLEVPTAPGGVTGGVQNFGAWRGKPVQSVTAYTGTTSWSSITGISDQGQTQYWAGTGYHISWSIPLIPRDGSDTLENAATGADNANYASIARQLVAGGQGSSTLRLGWEAGGNWFTWGGSTDPAAYVKAFQQAVISMRAVPGAHFTFDWNYVLDSIDPMSLYPGNDYVDYIGTDIYDESYATSVPSSNHRAVWRNILEEKWGLNYLDHFAVAHGKRFTIPEWGVNYLCDGHGGGDDPYFVQQMRSWIDGHDVAYDDYANGDNSSCEKYALSSGTEPTTTFPAAAAAYVEAFGSPITDDVSPALPETRMAILLPIAAAGVLYLGWSRRRRRRKSLRIGF